MGRHRKALALVEEALARRGSGPGRAGADRANALARRAEILDGLGRKEEALAAVTEAASILAERAAAGAASADAFLVDLTACRILSAKLNLDLGRGQAVLQVTLELLQDVRDAWDRLAALPATPDLAAVYFDLCQLALAIRLPEHALPFATLAAQEYAALHERDPHHFADDLADARALQASVRAALERPEEVAER